MILGFSGVNYTGWLYIALGYPAICRRSRG